MYSGRRGRAAPVGGLEDILSYEGSLGIAPAVVAAVVPVAAKLVNAVLGLFKKKPSAAQLQHAKDQAQFWVDRYVEYWKRGDRNAIADLKGTVRAYSTSKSMPDYMKEAAANTLAVIAQYDAQYPAPPAYTGPLIVAIQTDNLTPPRRTPLYLLPPAGGAWTQTGTTVVDQPDGSRSTVPVYIRNASAPITDFDTGSGQQAVTEAGSGGGGTFVNQAGILGSGSSSLLLLAGVGLAVYLLNGRR